jgi:hypothetical protein
MTRGPLALLSLSASLPANSREFEYLLNIFHVDEFFDAIWHAVFTVCADSVRRDNCLDLCATACDDLSFQSTDPMSEIAPI